MTIFGKLGDPELFLGRVLSTDRYGWIVQEGTGTSYLRKDLSRVFEGNFASAGIWSQWARTFNAPAYAEPMGPPTIEVMERPKRPRKQPRIDFSAPSAPVYPGPVISLLTFKVNGTVVIQGTETAGINLKEYGVDIETEGTGSITIKGPHVVGV